MWREKGLPHATGWSSCLCLSRLQVLLFSLAHPTITRTSLTGCHSSNTPLGICSPGCHYLPLLSSAVEPWLLPCLGHPQDELGWPVIDLICFLPSQQETSPSQISLHRLGKGEPHNRAVWSLLWQLIQSASKPPPFQGPTASGGQIQWDRDEHRSSSKLHTLPSSLPTLFTRLLLYQCGHSISFSGGPLSLPVIWPPSKLPAVAKCWGRGENLSPNSTQRHNEPQLCHRQAQLYSSVHR